MGNNNIDFSASSFSLSNSRRSASTASGANSTGLGTTRNKIAAAASSLTESANSSGVSRNADIEAAIAKEDKLDQVLDLLEEITGKDVSEKELAVFIKGFEAKLTLAPTVSGKTLRDKDSILTQKEVDSKPDVDPGTENAFSNFKVDFYKSQKDGLENLLDDWKGVNSPEAKKEVAKIKNQIKIVDKATAFWQGRADSWEEKMKEGGSKVGDDKFSTFKSNFYKSQLTGLENLMDEWLSVDDNSPKTTKQIAEIDKQIKLVERADKFWTKENDFWAKENKTQYKPENQKQVKDIYAKIETAEAHYDAAIMGDTKLGAPETLLKNLNALKGSLDKLKIKQTANNDKQSASGKTLRDKDSILTQKDVDSKPGVDKPGIDPGTENAFSNFKVDFYKSQKDGLENLLDDWKGVNSPEAKKEVAKIKNQIKIVDKATNFWQGRADSWEEKMKEGGSKVGDDKFSTFKSDFYKSQLTGLENLMDEWLSVGDDSPKANKQIAEIDKQIKLVERADKFWTKENDFWAKENKTQYKPENQKQVKDIYAKIETAEAHYDAAIMGDTKLGAPETLLKNLNALKGSLDKLKIKQTANNDKPLKTNFKEDASFADFKTDFYESQKPGLKQLMDKFIKAGDRNELANIREVITQTDVAKNFWKDEHEFWTDLDKMKFPSENEKQLKTLTNKVIELESMIDEVSISPDATGENMAKKAGLVSELNSVKSDIYSLQA